MKRGANAFSCDLQEPSGNRPDRHILGDVLPLIEGGVFRTMDGVEHRVDEWDLIVAHPECRYISAAGACRLYPRKGQIDQARYQKGLEAKEFFMRFYNASCKHIAIENPTPMKAFEMPPYTQVIQPYEYGHPYSKRTCLWLKGLPELKPTNIVEPLGSWVCGNADVWRKQAAKGKVYGKEKSPKHRAKTFEGIAEAMAEQWTEYLRQEGYV